MNNVPPPYMAPPPPYAQVSPQSSLTGFNGNVPSPLRIPTHNSQPFVVYPQQPQMQLAGGCQQLQAPFFSQTVQNVGQYPLIVSGQNASTQGPFYIVVPPQGSSGNAFNPQQQFVVAPQTFGSAPPMQNFSLPVQIPQPVQMGGSQTGQPIFVMPMPTIEMPQVHPNASLTGGSVASASTSSRPPTDVSVWGYAVVDQYHPSLQRLPVPPSVVTKTKGSITYNNDVQSSSTKPCSSTICLKFSSKNSPIIDSCPLGDQCAAFHVERSYLEAARKISEPLCCALHNDYFSQEMLASNCAPHMTHQRFTLVLDDRAEVELVPSQLSMTVGLDQLSHRGYHSSSTRVINMRKQVCRLHYEGKCKWTKDCGHVHLCRELHRFLLSFHFPSLIFLLMTESSKEKIYSKLCEEPQLGEFIRSKCVLPLVTQLIEAKKSAALTALVAAGALMTDDQAEVIRALQIADCAPAGTKGAVCEKIAFLLRPKTSVRIDEALVAVQIAEAVISSPTHGGRSLTMPTFSPGASATSLGADHHLTPAKAHD